MNIKEIRDYIKKQYDNGTYTRLDTTLLLGNFELVNKPNFKLIIKVSKEQTFKETLRNIKEWR